MKTAKQRKPDLVSDTAVSLPTPPPTAGGPDTYRWDPSKELPPDILLCPFNTGGPVDLRWRVICQLIQGVYSRRAWKDPWIRRGLRYQRASLACQSDADRRRLALEMPDLDTAYQLHASSDKLARGIVEASMLSGMSVAQVAEFTGLTLEAVQAYEALFFQVLGKLEARLFILFEAIGGKFHHGLTEEDIDVFLKWVAYFKGPLILPSMVRYYTSGRTMPDRLDGLTREELEDLHAMLSIRALILSHVLPFERYQPVLRLMTLLDELDNLIKSRPVGVPALPTALEVKVSWEAGPVLTRTISAGNTPEGDSGKEEVAA